MDAIGDLTKQFEESARKHYAATMQGDYRAVSREAKKTEKIFLRIRELGPSAREALLQLALASEPEVAVRAAAYSLKYSPEQSLQILSQISKDRGMLGFGAEQAIKRWKSGEWNLE